MKTEFLSVASSIQEIDRDRSRKQTRRIGDDVNSRDEISIARGDHHLMKRQRKVRRD
jgi:hypothetical protein